MCIRDRGGAICYEDGILLLKTIIDYHKNGDEEEMATIVGLYKEDLQRIIRSEKEEEQVSIACENHDYCFVLSGKRESVLNITEADVYKRQEFCLLWQSSLFRVPSA